MNAQRRAGTARLCDGEIATWCKVIRGLDLLSEEARHRTVPGLFLDHSVVDHPLERIYSYPRRGLTVKPIGAWFRRGF